MPEDEHVPMADEEDPKNATPSTGRCIGAVLALSLMVSVIVALAAGAVAL